jgi:flagellar hook-associated protein 2
MVTSVSSTSGSSTSTSNISSASSTSSADTTLNKAATGQNVMKALGSGSGIDTAALAQSLVDAEKAPRAAAINKNISKSQAVVSGYAAVKYALSAVKTAFDDLKDVSDFSAVTATSNQADVFSVTTSTGTQPGSHSILVTQLAQEQRIASTQVFETADKSLSNTPFDLFVGEGTSNPITVSNPTPSGVVDAINQSSKGLSAQLVNTGSGYKITVSGASGSTNAFVLSSEATTLDFGNHGARTQISNSNQKFGSADNINVSAVYLNGNTLDPIKFDNPSPDGFVTTFNESHQALGANLRADYVGGKLVITNLTEPSTLANAFTITTDNGDALAFTVKQSAQTSAMSKPLQEAKDAILQVDGLPVTSATNSVSGVIPGVTLNLSGTNAVQVNGDVQAKGSPASLSLAIDTSVAKAKITALVTAYNDANDLLDQVSNPKSTLATYGGTLVGNSSVRSMRDQLRQLVTQDFYHGGSFHDAHKDVNLSTKPDTWPAGTALKKGAPSALRDIGIEIDSKGKLTTNSVKLDMALSLNYADTVTMLSGNQENQAATDKLNTSGVAGDASRSLTALLGASGAITTETDNANKRITKLQDDLTALNDRMTMILARYQKQFAAMDSMVGQTKATQTGLTSTFAGMMAMYTNK